MILGDVQSVKVVELVLDLGAFNDSEAEATHDVFEFGNRL